MIQKYKSLFLVIGFFHRLITAVICLPILLVLFSLSARADYTTVDISGYINGQISTNVADDPIGLSTGNTGSNVPFFTYAESSITGNNYMGSIFIGSRVNKPNSVTINLSGYNLSGQVSFYMLLNNYWGTPCSASPPSPANCTNEYNVALNFADGGTQVFPSYGGYDTRDYNQNPGTTNTISATTGNWWTNIATRGASNYQRLDVRAFTINSINQITGITINQVKYEDPAFLSGLTFSTLAPVALPPADAPVVTLTNITNTALNSHLVSALGVTLNPTFQGGTLTADANGTISKDFIVMANGGTIDLNSKNVVLTGTLANLTGAAGSLAIKGGSLIAAGNNSSFSGNLQVIAGANLSASSSSNLGSGTLSLLGTPTTAATLTTTATMTINNAIRVEGDPIFNVAPGTTTTVSSVIADGSSWGDIQVSGGGTLNLTGINTYTGPTIIDLGSRLELNGLGTIAASGNAGQGGVLNNGSFDISGKTGNVSLVSYNQSSTGVLKVNFSPLNNQVLIISGATSLAGGIILNASSGIYSPGRYTILSSTGGVSGSFSTSTINTYSYTSLVPSFSYDANNVYFNLALSGPTAADTQASMTPNAYALRGAYSLQSAIINTGLSYDCTTFDKNGICVSAGGRVTDTNNPSTNSQGALLIASYRANEHWRVGAYLDQNLSSNDARGVNLDNNNPMGGVFAVWNQNTDGTGYQVRLASGYSDKDVTISRSAFGASGEAGKGDSSLQSQAYSATLSRGFQLNNTRWIASPYLGVRYTKIKRAGYTEDSSADVTAPLTYSALSQETTTALVGVRFNGQLGDKINLMASAGIENDIAHNTGDYAATGVDGLTPIAFNQNIRHIRPVASAGASYAIDKRQTVGANLNFRQEAFNSTNSVSGMVTYQVGF